MSVDAFSSRVLGVCGRMGFPIILSVSWGINIQYTNNLALIILLLKLFVNLEHYELEDCQGFGLRESSVMKYWSWSENLCLPEPAIETCHPRQEEH